MSSPGPASFKRRVLVSVSGLTPQIVTETVYALSRRAPEPFLPTRIVLLTTSEGADRARLTLQGDSPGWLDRLCQDYALPKIAFSVDDIVILRDAAGASMPDIRTEADNRAAADAIVDTIRVLTADPDCALHVSMAGGRKTLGFFAGYALSLYGRVQDRLSHVLVSGRFEGNPDFYYPTPYRRVIYDRDKSPLDTATAKVELAEIPLVHMRDGLPDALRTGSATYGQAVAAVQQRLQAPGLVIDLGRGRAIAGGVDLELPPLLIAFYTWFARARIAGVVIEKSLDKQPAEVAERHARAFLVEYGKLVNVAEHGTINTTLAKGMQFEFFGQQRAKLNRLIRGVLETAAAPYLVQAAGRRTQLEYTIGLAPAAITIVEP